MTRHVPPATSPCPPPLSYPARRSASAPANAPPLFPPSAHPFPCSTWGRRPDPALVPLLRHPRGGSGRQLPCHPSAWPARASQPTVLGGVEPSTGHQLGPSMDPLVTCVVGGGGQAGGGEGRVEPPVYTAGIPRPVPATPPPAGDYWAARRGSSRHPVVPRLHVCPRAGGRLATTALGAALPDASASPASSGVVAAPLGKRRVPRGGWRWRRQPPSFAPVHRRPRLLGWEAQPARPRTSSRRLPERSGWSTRGLAWRRLPPFLRQRLTVELSHPWE